MLTQQVELGASSQPSQSALVLSDSLAATYGLVLGIGLPLIALLIAILYFMYRRRCMHNAHENFNAQRPRCRPKDYEVPHFECCFNSRSGSMLQSEREWRMNKETGVFELNPENGTTPQIFEAPDMYAQIELPKRIDPRSRFSSL